MRNPRAAECRSLLDTGPPVPLGDLRATVFRELGRPLELPWLAGAVVDLGAQKGVPTPCCRAVRDILALYVDGKPA